VSRSGLFLLLFSEFIMLHKSGFLSFFESGKFLNITF
jgi:hypothetical protein